MKSPLEGLRRLVSRQAHQERIDQRRSRNLEDVQHTVSLAEDVQPTHVEPTKPVQTSQFESDTLDSQHEMETESVSQENNNLDTDPKGELKRHDGTSSVEQTSQRQRKPRWRQIRNPFTWWSNVIRTGFKTKPFIFPQMMHRSGSVPDGFGEVWKCVGVSVTGTSHIKKQMPCQDSHLFRELPGGVLIIAVADGAGSAILSKQGSQLVVKEAVTYLSTAISLYRPESDGAWKYFVSQAFVLAYAKLIQHALKQRKPVREFATTLQIVVTTEHWTVSAIIGDGTAVVLATDDSIHSIMTPQRGEYASETNFVTGSSSMHHVDIKVWKCPAQGVAVLTDGIVHLSINEQNNQPTFRFFMPFFKFLVATRSQQQAETHLVQFLESDQVNSKTDDDKTLVLALRQSVSLTLGMNSCATKQKVEDELN